LTFSQPLIGADREIGENWPEPGASWVVSPPADRSASVAGSQTFTWREQQ
jgi:hypothetical protein